MSSNTLDPQVIAREQTSHTIRKDELVTSTGALLVRVPAYPEDPTQQQVLRIIEESGVLEFWKSEGDEYSLEDGEPI